MAAEVRWPSIVALVVFDIYLIYASAPFKRFEYKYSFKPPYLAQKDGSVPFWEYGGNAIASEENVRIAPSLRSQKGAIWTKAKTNFDWWEVDILFRVTGRGRIGADGLAFWYTENKGAYDGAVFGSSDKWNGLGIFFDSFDNDNKHNNPYIMAIVNDGTKEFDHQNDGTTQLLAGCLRDFRNKPFPTRARIEYYMNTLTVLFHSGMTNNEQDMEVCLRVDNVVLPKFGHFGLSAATGGLADDHDVLHFLTSSLHVPGQAPTAAPAAPRVSEEDQRKLNQEYTDYQRKLDLQKEEYMREHPEAAGRREDPDADPDGWFESDGQRELRQIFTGQSQMFEVLRELSRKLDEVVGRQERAMSLIGQLGTGVAAPPQGHPVLNLSDYNGNMSIPLTDDECQTLELLPKDQLHSEVSREMDVTQSPLQTPSHQAHVIATNSTLMQDQNQINDTLNTSAWVSRNKPIHRGKESEALRCKNNISTLADERRKLVELEIEILNEKHERENELRALELKVLEAKFDLYVEKKNAAKAQKLYYEK